MRRYLQINQNKYYFDFGRQTFRHLISLTKTDEHAKGPVFSNYDSCWVIIAGILKDIRTGIGWGDSGKQMFHKWPFERIIKKLTNKAQLEGIGRNTTQRTSPTGVRRGLYVCKQCDAVINADADGTINIFKRYLPGANTCLWLFGTACDQPACLERHQASDISL